MLITSLKSSAEIGTAANPWWVYHPTLENYVALLGSSQFLIFFKNSIVVSVCVVSVTMVIAILAAFSLARMGFWGSETLSTGVFLTFLITETILFIPLFKTFAWIHDTTGIELINHWWTLIARLSNADGAVLYLDHDRVFFEHPEGTRRGGPDRRRELLSAPHPDLHPGGAAGDHRRDDLRLYGVVGGFPLSARLYDPRSSRPWPLVGIVTTLIKGDVFNWGQIMTGARLGAATPLIIYAFLMDYYISGLTAGATKG